MTITTGVSFLGQSNAQMTRLSDLQKTLNDLQRQATTQKKNDTFSGFGFDAQSLQRYRMDKSRLDSYLSNIDTVSTRIDVMSKGMEKAADLGRQLLGSIQTQVREGTVDIETMKTLAKDALEFVRDIMNTQVDGRYLFSGASTSTEPLDSLNTVNTAIQAEVSNWLNGTITTAQMNANIEALTATGMGFNPALSSAGEIALRIDKTTEIDYTVLAIEDGFQDIVRALGFMANMELPDPATDVPTQTDFHDVLDQIQVMVKRGVDALDQRQTTVGSKFNLIKSIQETHEQDIALFDSAIAQKENVDLTEVVAKLQVLQTQMQVSYQVTSIVSQLSLVNYIAI